MSNINDRTLTLERTFDATIKLVWEAWTQSEHIAHWWAPKGMKLDVLEHNFKVGGSWKYSMLMPNGQKFIAEGIYKEIVEQDRIISEANFRPMTEGVEIQAFFEANGDQTRFTFKVVHPTVAYCQQQEKMGFMNGWGSVFGQLKDYLEALSS